MIRITLILEESREAEILLGLLNLAGESVKLEGYTKSEGCHFTVKDREAIKALTDTINKGRSTVSKVDVA